MDNLDVVRAVYEDRFGNAGSFKESFADNKVNGYGIGFNHWRTRTPKKNQKYAIVMLVDPDISAAELKRLPRQITVNKKDILLLANNKSLPKRVSINVRYEKDRPEPLSVLNAPASNVPAAALAATFTAGEALFSQGIFIGTGGFVFQFNGAPHIASNRHVLANAGKGNPVSNRAGNALATVVTLNPAPDSGLAIVRPGIGFSNMLPGIGNPRSFGPPLRLTEQARKTGASTQLTQIQVFFEGVHEGVPVIRGTNIRGKNIPAVGVGDSGSVVVNMQTEITSLVIGGSEPIGSTPAGPLFSILWAVDIRTAFQGISIP